MHRVRVGMQMSSRAALVEAATGLAVMPGLRVVRRRDRGRLYLEVVIATPDPDDVDIAREVVWQFDPEAVQESVHLLEVHAGGRL